MTNFEQEHKLHICLMQLSYESVLSKASRVRMVNNKTIKLILIMNAEYVYHLHRYSLINQCLCNIVSEMKN